MTDVTGFGLAGHLMAICEASGTAAEIALDAVPLLDGAEALAADLNGQRSESAVALRADLASCAQLEQLAASACAAFSSLDILVNNASSYYPTPFGEIDQAAWDDLVTSNYKAPLFLAQACYPSLRAAGGCIINLLDIYASQPLMRHSVYCSAKAANRMLVESLALELARDNIRVNGIAPGVIDTPMWKHVDAQFAEYENKPIGQKKREVGEAVPLGRMGDPADVADPCVFLASDEARYITAQTINVDGGNWMS